MKNAFLSPFVGIMELLALISFLFANAPSAKADTLVDEDKWAGVVFTYDNLAKAKYYAKVNQRPLLVVCSMDPCAHCDNFDAKIVNTTAFKNYIKAHKIVTCVSRNNNLLLTTKNTYRAGYDAYYSGAPHVYLFKVNDDANCETTSSTSLKNDQVTPLKSNSLGQYFIGSYKAGETFMGIKNGAESAWNPTTFTSQIAACFPNQFWSGIDSGITPDIPVDPDDPDNPDDPDDPDDPVTPVDPGTESEWLGVYFNYSQLAKAKSYALSNNRPLLLIASMDPCAHCDNFDAKILETTTFKNFVKKNKIVVVASRDNNLLLTTKNAYRSGYDAYYSGAPHVYLFKVREDANCTTASSGAFKPDQVDVLKSTKLNKYFVGSYKGGETFMGIANGAEASWNPSTFCSQIEACFPNQGWKTLTPPAEGLTGYESATDLGKIYNTTYKPAKSTEAIVNMGSVTFKGKSSEKWYKFTGRTGQRFSMYARDLTNASGTLTYTLEVFGCSANTTKPVEPAIATFKAKTYDYLNGNFHFDIPASSNEYALFYIRIVATGTATTNAATFSMRIHETKSNPAVGYITNPAWKGAQKGKWSMDTEAVLAAAYKTKTPVLAYFGAVTWCPKCACLEQNVLSTPDFAAAISGYYAINFDYRLRSADDSTGPCLLTETDGYRSANSITDAMMTAKLKENRAWQEKLSLDNVVKTGWEKGAIPYPTMVFCRVKATTRGSYDLEPVGRFPFYPNPEPADMYVNITVEETLEALTLFQDLFDVGYAESVNNRTSSMEYLDPNAAFATAYVGDHNDAYWTSFPIDGTTWFFHIQSDDADENAIATVSVYDLLGDNLFVQETGSLNEGISILFTPKNQDNTAAWLSIEVQNQKTMAAIGIFYLMEGDITAYASLPETEIAIPHTTQIVEVPVTLDIQQQNDSKLVFQYRVIPSVESPAPTTYFAGTDWTDFEWDNKEISSSVISVPLNIPASVSWSGTKDFIVEIRHKDDNTCLIRDNSTTIVKLATTPLFLPKLEQTSFTLYKGLYNSIFIPVCPAATMSITKPTLPKGLDYEIPEDKTFICIHGTPTETTSQASTVTLSLKQGSKTTDTVKLTLSIEAPPFNAVNRKAFIAPIKRESSTTTSIDGTLFISKNDNGSLDIFLNALDTIATGNVPAWTYDASQGCLALTCTLSDNSTLYVTLSDDTVGNVSILTGHNKWLYTGNLLPVTDTDAEQYAGIYNVVIRQNEDVQGVSLGWMQILISEDATAQITINLYGMDTLTTKSCLYWDGNASNSFAQLPYFLPLFGNQTDGFAGRIGGVLDIVRPSKRTDGAIETWVSGCGNVQNLYIGLTGVSMVLLPCGTTYTPGQSISQHTGTESFLFVADNVDATNIIVPSAIPMMEKIDEKGDCFLPLTTGLCIDNSNQLTVNQKNGLLTGQLSLLVRDTATNIISRTSVELSGIFVPTTVACCDIDDNIAVAYGCFTYDNLIYTIRLFPEEQYKATPLNVQRQSNSVQATSSAAPAYIFYQRLDNGTTFCKYSEATSISFSTLDKTTPWHFSALATSGIDSNGNTVFYTESPMETLENTSGTSTTTYSTASEDKDYRLSKGWNLIAIPENLAIAPGELPPILFAFDEQLQTYVIPSKLLPGHAYWLFVPSTDNEMAFSFSSTPIQLYDKQVFQEGRWAMGPVPSDTTNLEMWTFDNGVFNQVDNVLPPPSKGVFIYKKAE